jgi:hypothetical protein
MPTMRRLPSCCLKFERDYLQVVMNEGLFADAIELITGQETKVLSNLSEGVTSFK